MKMPISLLLLLVAWPALADEPGAEANRPVHVAGSVYVLYGRGGNVGISVGDDGVFLVDDQYAPQAPAILEAVRSLRDEPVRFVLNTHWHGDHTGGNEAMAGQGALIVAHDNVRRRMSSEQFIQAFGSRVPPSPAAALPVVTFSESLTLHINGDTVRVTHLAPAHTDGDSFVHFTGADVIHAGDIYFNGMYPFIDVSAGGHIDGVIAACDRLLALAGEHTRIIPGHGPVSDRNGLRAYREMLAAVRARVAEGMAAGYTLERIQADAPTAAYDAVWGKGFLDAAKFVAIVYDALGSGRTPTQGTHADD